MSNPHPPTHDSSEYCIEVVEKFEEPLFKNLTRRFFYEDFQGFQIIRSRHVATNNAVLIPKLKMGFIITGMELSDSFGTLLHLSYFTHPQRRKLMDVRAGLSRPNEALRGVIHQLM